MCPLQSYNKGEKLSPIRGSKEHFEKKYLGIYSKEEVVLDLMSCCKSKKNTEIY